MHRVYGPLLEEELKEKGCEVVVLDADGDSSEEVMTEKIETCLRNGRYDLFGCSAGQGSCSVARAVDEVLLAVSQCHELSREMVRAASEQQGATTRICQNIQQAAESTREVSCNTQALADISRETWQTASELAGSTGQLADCLAGLRLETTRFLERMRAS